MGEGSTPLSASIGPVSYLRPPLAFTAFSVTNTDKVDLG